VDLLSALLTDAKYIPTLDILKQNVSLNGDVTFKKNLKLGAVTMRLQIYPLENGNIEINIKEATIAGFGAFGVVRKKAGELIVTSLSKYLSQCKIWKNDKGNVEFQVPNITFEQFAIVGEDMLIELLI
jgi:hypothetical protein